MITATTWVPKGFAAQFPKRYDVTEEEFERIADMARLQLADAQEDLKDARAEAVGEGESGAEREGEGEEEEEEGKVEGHDEDGTKRRKARKKAKKKAKKAAAIAEQLKQAAGTVGTAPAADDDDKEDTEDIDDDLKEYDLENYDEPTEEEKTAGESMGMFGNIKGLAFYQPGEADPYITMNDQDDQEEREELQILPTDNLLLATKTEDDVCHLEVYVYEDDTSNLYVHHDIMLPAIPLCLEWLDIPVGAAVTNTADSRGNYVAIGTMDPDIEIWDLDTVDGLYPNAILGAGNITSAAAAAATAPKKRSKKAPKPNTTHHVDAILALASNRHHRNLLASASADHTVKLWDLNTTQCARSYAHHTDKVCALAWHPRDTTTLLTGSYDRTVVWADLRAPDAAVPRWGVDSDVEDVRWDPHDTAYFYVATESGRIHLFDTRALPASAAASKPVWTLQAHDRSVSSFDVSAAIPGFLVSGSVDKTVKLWNMRAAPGGGGGGPSMVASRDLGVGKVFSTRFAPDAEVAFRVAVAGSKGVVTVWDTSTNAGVRRTFQGRVVEGVEGETERVVAVDESSGESDSEDEDGGVAVAETDGKGPDGWESMDEEE